MDNPGATCHREYLIQWRHSELLVRLAHRGTLADMRAAILLEVSLSRRNFADLRQSLQRTVDHWQHMTRLRLVERNEGNYLTLQEECQALSAELFQSRLVCNDWQERHHDQVCLIISIHRFAWCTSVPSSAHMMMPIWSR